MGSLQMPALQTPDPKHPIQPCAAAGFTRCVVDGEWEIEKAVAAVTVTCKFQFFPGIIPIFVGSFFP